MAENEGYIKFIAHWENKAFHCDWLVLEEINSVRSSLITKGWLGVLPNGIGFGNISVRIGSTEKFMITGSATGGIEPLETAHFACVEKYSIAENQLWCTGLTIASSESLTHAALYASNKAIKAVLHIHAAALWNKYLDHIPTSEKKAAYGTPEMAHSITTLLNNKKEKSGIIVMGGHPDGLIAFGQNIEQIFESLCHLNE